MSIQDTKERIFMNGQIYSRPRFGGPVGAPDNRRFTPDPNPYGVEPEPRGYGQGTVDTFEVLPLDFMNQYINNRGITEQNQEVMGSKKQVFPRYANPADGTLTIGAPQGPPHVLVDGPPIRRYTLFDLNVDWENTSPENLRQLQKMLEDMYKDEDSGELFLNQAEPMEGALMAADPIDKAAYGPEMTRKQFSNYMEMRNPGFKARTDALRMRLISAGILPRV